MKSPLILTLLAGSMLVPAAAAQAQEQSDFSGPRIEIIGGYDQLRSGSDVDIETDDDGIFDDVDIDQSVDGFAYGAAIGYDFDLGSVVIGLDAEYMDSTGEQETDEDIAAPFGYRINLNRDLYLGARIGAKVTPSTLLYAKGGYTNTRVESRFQDQALDDGFDLDFDDAQSIDGFRVGAGVEQLIGPGFVKLEYRYSNYSGLKFDDELFNDNSEIGIDLDRHQVVAGIGIRF